MRGAQGLSGTTPKWLAVLNQATVLTRRQEGLYQHPHAPYMCPLHTDYFPSPPLADYGLSRPSRAFPAIVVDYCTGMVLDPQ